MNRSLSACLCCHVNTWWTKWSDWTTVSKSSSIIWVRLIISFTGRDQGSLSGPFTFILSVQQELPWVHWFIQTSHTRDLILGDVCFFSSAQFSNATRNQEMVDDLYLPWAYGRHGETVAAATLPARSKTGRLVTALHFLPVNVRIDCATVFKGLHGQVLACRWIDFPLLAWSRPEDLWQLSKSVSDVFWIHLCFDFFSFILFELSSLCDLCSVNTNNL